MGILVEDWRQAILDGGLFLDQWGKLAVEFRWTANDSSIAKAKKEVDALNVSDPIWRWSIAAIGTIVCLGSPGGQALRGHGLLNLPCENALDGVGVGLVMDAFLLQKIIAAGCPTDQAEP